MSHRNQPLVLFVLFLFSISVFAQTEVDTTLQKSYNEIHDLYQKSKSSDKKLFLLGVFLKKAKKENSFNDQLRGYHLFSLFYNDEKKLQYADSIIYLTKVNHTKYYPAYGYKIKGDYYYNKKAYKRALDNFLQFSFYAKKQKNRNLIFNSKYYIGITKRRTGDYEEALEIYKENLSYAQNNKSSIDSKTYLNTFTALVNLYNQMKAVDSAAHYIKYGIKEARNVNQKHFISHFSLSQGVVHHFRGEFSIAIDSIEKQIPNFIRNKNYDNLSFAYYYAGESYRKLNHTEKAIYYFKKVDTIFQKNQSLFPTLRENYIRLRDYYKDKNDYKNQLVYLDKLIKVDSILSEDKIYLNGGIIKKYDIPKLKAEKENISREMKEKESIFKNTTILLSVLILLLIIGFGIQYTKRKRYRKRFNSIINNETPIQKKSSENPNKKISVPEDIVKNILEKLKTFEEKSKFTSNEITLNSLAKKLHTNPNYLSKVINHYKKSSFSNYLNNLRIDYTIYQLKTNPVYKKYTIKAISSEVGFNNVQSFAKAFYNSKGINPSFFIRELKKVKP